MAGELACAPPVEALTARLRLRAPRIEDAGPIFQAYAADPVVTRHLTWRANTDAAQTREFIAACIAEWERRETFNYVMELQDEPGRPIGMIGARPGSHGVVFGYVLARPHWGRGLMSEALRAQVDFWLSWDGVHRCSAFCDVDNPASGRVMEKAGMVFEGVARRYSIHPALGLTPRDCRIYAKVR